jgi:hypothetical protein
MLAYCWMLSRFTAETFLGKSASLMRQHASLMLTGSRRPCVIEDLHFGAGSRQVNQDCVVKQEIVSAVVQVREIMGKLSQHQTSRAFASTGFCW